MKGIELSELFYREYGEPMLREGFAEYLPLIAVGIAGCGSERFGYDDGISKDHDFEAGFCIFLPEEDVVDRRVEFALERAYSKLPSEFMGVKRAQLSAVGGNRYGVIRIEDFFLEKTGSANGELSLKEWIFTPEQSLAEATNGKVFYDGLGLFCKIRKAIEYMPEDARLKKLAGELLIMGQSGQYNYERCIARGESGAAQLAVFEFVRSAMHVVFLLNRRYMPYYKWSFRALSELALLSELRFDFEHLISSENKPADVARKQIELEKISNAIISEIREQRISDFCGDELEGHAYAVNSKISDAGLRNMHVLSAI